MSKLKEIWIESNANQMPAIRIDWDNDRHQRIELTGRTPESLISDLNRAAFYLTKEVRNSKI